MEKPLFAAERLTLTTVRVECPLADGDVSMGTAFVFGFPRGPNAHAPVLITNRHVVRGAVGLRFKLRAANFAGDTQFDLPVSDASWIKHPDPLIDLAALPVAEQFNFMAKEGKTPYYQALTPNDLPTVEHEDGFNAVESVLMVGYPEGIWDSVNNMPIVRSGITATHPATDYEGRPEFLVDMAVFYGSSGSPVFLDTSGLRAPRSPKRTPNTGLQLLQETPPVLLGVLYGVVARSEDRPSSLRIVNVPTAATEANSRDFLNLGTVVKSRMIMDLDQLLPRHE